jgi:hypothetical protein
MKGPAARWKHEVRRLWECPACHRRERTGGQVVNLLCGCRLASDLPRQTGMNLIEEGPQHEQPPTPANEQPAS